MNDHLYQNSTAPVLLSGIFVRRALGCLVLAAALMLAGCGRSGSSAASPDAEPILGVVRANIEAMQTEDVPAVLATMHPDSPGKAQTGEMVQKLAAAYDLKYALPELSLISATGTEAQVRFVQITEKVSGPEFRNNRVEGTHFLNKHEGAWKLFKTDVKKVEYLDE